MLAQPLVDVLDRPAPVVRLQLELFEGFGERVFGRPLELLAEPDRGRPLLVDGRTELVGLRDDACLDIGDLLPLKLLELGDLAFERSLGALEVGFPRAQALLRAPLDGGDHLGEALGELPLTNAQLSAPLIRQPSLLGDIGRHRVGVGARDGHPQEVRLGRRLLLGRGAHCLSGLCDEVVGPGRARSQATERAPEEHGHQERSEESSGEDPGDHGHAIMLEARSEGFGSKSGRVGSCEEKNERSRQRATPEVGNMRRTRTVMWCAFGAAVFATGLSAGIGTAGSTERAAAGATRLTAGLDARQEVPSSERYDGRYARKLHRDARTQGPSGNAHLAPDVSSADREGDCRPRASRQAGPTGTGGARTLRPLSKRRARIGEGKGRSRTGVVDRRCVRERAHRAESGRRDTRPDPGRLDGSPALDDDDHDVDEQHRRGSLSVGIRSSEPRNSRRLSRRVYVRKARRSAEAASACASAAASNRSAFEKKPCTMLSKRIELRRHACLVEPLGIALALVSKRVETGCDHERGGEPGEIARAER